MSSPFLQGTINATLLTVAFCETFEHVVAMHALLDDPHHQTKRQGSAVARLLRDGLRSVEDRLQALRPALAWPEPTNAETARSLAGIGTAMDAVRQLHAHLDYLGARWTLGTADLFVRKLAGEGLPIPIPILSATNRLDEPIEDLSLRLRDRMRADGLPLDRQEARILLALPAAHLPDPLRWPGLVMPLVAVLVERHRAAGDLPEAAIAPGAAGESARRTLAAALAAHVLGEAAAVAGATQQLVGGAGGAPPDRGMALLYGFAAAFSAPAAPDSAGTLVAFFTGLVNRRKDLHGEWGRVLSHAVDADAARFQEDARRLAGELVPAPITPDFATMQALCEKLVDGQPINALPLHLHHSFAVDLAAAVESDHFYEAIRTAGEQPATLALILGAGWRYKLGATYPLCRTLMVAPIAWQQAQEQLSAHVLERSSLLQQSIEAAHIHQSFARWRES